MAAGPAWTTYHHDGLRSGYDPDSTSPLPPAQAWQTPALDGQIYGQPLVYGSRVYVATENDSVYALDAGSGAVIWRTNFGTPVPDGGGSPMGCGDLGQVGVTSTPVIDPATGRIFAVGDRWDGAHASTIEHVLAGLSLSTGVLVSSPRPVDPPGSHPAYQLQRPGLALDAGRIVIGFGGNSGDCNDYHGWLVSAPETGSGQLDSFEVDGRSGDNQGAIWGAGNAPAVDAGGNIWVATGNGSSSSYDYQESVLKFSPALGLVGAWAPSNWSNLDSGDTDLGSSEPLPLPGGMFFQIGKEGVGYLLSSAPSQLYSRQVCSGEAFGGGTYYGGVIYVACADGLRALALNVTAHTFAPLSTWNPSDHPMGPPIIAAGMVWSADWGGSSLFALDRGTGATRFSADLGGFNHFASPSAGGGRLFIADGNQVTAFTIARPPAPPPPTPRAPIISGAKLAVGAKTLTLTLSEPASVRLVISRIIHGRRVRGRCRAGARHGHLCRYSKRKFTATFSGRAGTDHFKLRWHRLGAGSYSLSIIATASGLHSRPHMLHFRLRR